MAWWVKPCIAKLHVTAFTAGQREALVSVFHNWLHPAVKNSRLMLEVGQTPPDTQSTIVLLERFLFTPTPLRVSPDGRDPFVLLPVLVIGSIQTLLLTQPLQQNDVQRAARDLALTVEPFGAKLLWLLDQDKAKSMWSGHRKPTLTNVLQRLGKLGRLPYDPKELSSSAFVEDDPKAWEARSSFQNALRDVVSERLDSAHRSMRSTYPWQSVAAVILGLVWSSRKDLEQCCVSQLPQTAATAKLTFVIDHPFLSFSSAKAQEFVEAVAKTTGVQLKIVEIGAGSVRLVTEAPAMHVAKFLGLVREEDPPLLGLLRSFDVITVGGLEVSNRSLHKRTSNGNGRTKPKQWSPPGGHPMSTALSNRLDKILPRVTSEAFLSSEGIGNEIACYIFDYEASDELRVRGHTAWMNERFSSHHSSLKVLHLDLLDVVVRYLKKRKLFGKALDMESSKGDAAVLKALKGPLHAEKIRDFIDEEHNPSGHDLILLSGVGSVWPMLRAHSLLNSLHTVLGHTPLVMFYPGNFDGTTLSLFGRITTRTSKPGTKPYYRAFILVPRETTT
jgi:hypothetical protein